MDESSLSLSKHYCNPVWLSVSHIVGSNPRLTYRHLQLPRDAASDLNGVDHDRENGALLLVSKGDMDI
jgi:hypothetical protein